jgi:hypothetical protein
VELVTLEVVPAAGDTDLDDIARELLLGRLELGQLPVGSDAAAVGVAEVVAVDVGDEAQAGSATHGAIAGELLADVATGPEELGMGITAVREISAAGPELIQNRSTGERVVDVPAHGGECRHPRPGRSATGRLP